MTNHYTPQAQPSDVGFGYIQETQVAIEENTGPKSPLKSAMKVPGTPRVNASRDGPLSPRFQDGPLSPRFADGPGPLSPTFRQEQLVEKHETFVEKEQAKDLVSAHYEYIFLCRVLTCCRK
jgi:hypothetical protein